MRPHSVACFRGARQTRVVVTETIEKGLAEYPNKE